MSDELRLGGLGEEVGSNAENWPSIPPHLENDLPVPPVPQGLPSIPIGLAEPAPISSYDPLF